MQRSDHPIQTLKLTLGQGYPAKARGKNADRIGYRPVNTVQKLNIKIDILTYVWVYTVGVDVMNSVWAVEQQTGRGYLCMEIIRVDNYMARRAE